MLLYRFQGLDSSSKPPRTGNRFMYNLECHSDAWKGLNCLDAVYQLDGVGSDIGRSSWLLLLKHKENSTAVSQRAGVTDSAPSEHWGLLIQGPFPCYTHRQIHSQPCTQRGAWDVPSKSVRAMRRCDAIHQRTQQLTSRRIKALKIEYLVWTLHTRVLLKFWPTVLSCWLLTITHLGKSV